MSRVHVRVRIGAESYAVPVGDVLEITDLGEVAPLPGAPAGVLGLRNLHGRVLPVIDVAGLLGLTSDARPQRIVVAEHAGRLAGLAVDRVTDVEALAHTEEEAAGPHLRGAALVDGALVGAIDVASVLDAIEQGR